MGLLKRHAAAFAVFFATAAAGSLASAPAHAQQPSASERETARNRMEEGENRRERGDLRGALRMFEEADAIMRVPTTGLEVARTQIQLGLLLEAKETLARVRSIPARAGEPPAFAAARKSADQLLGDLPPRIPTLGVTIKNADPASTPRVTIDGESVPLTAAESGRKVNPGTHLVVVSQGNIERRDEAKLVEGQAKTLTIDLGGGAGTTTTGTSGTSSSGTKDVAHDPKPEEKHSGSSTSKILVIGGFAVGALGIGVGAVTGIMSFGKVDDVKTKCGGTTCPPQYASDVDAAKNLGTLSTVSFIIGGVGAAVGVVGLVVPFGESEKPAPSNEASLRVRPSVGPGYLGLDGRF